MNETDGVVEVAEAQQPGGEQGEGGLVRSGNAVRELADEPGGIDTLAWPAKGPWSVRTTPRRNGRSALEIYEHDQLLDVLVGSSLTGELLRGARQSLGEGGGSGFAWGRLRADGSAPQVLFAIAKLREVQPPADVVTVAGEFWLAWVPGRVAGVLVRHPEGTTERLRPARVG
ncbi:hypothetical protein ACIGXM_23985 [Kitasatospora sp. NPDC052896]|uniref:hypothetical protein n=1 Tax=Kitasatospora sp. NPDC052896 TaxID=3364061 RepID=UPI0037CC69C8